MQTGMPDIMQEAMDAAFGAVVRAALQPLSDQVEALTVKVDALSSQVATIMETFEQFRSGKGMLARILNGG